jgi:hypothetical protein
MLEVGRIKSTIINLIVKGKNMAFKNPETEKYEAHFFIKQTGQLIIGVGKTKEKAKEDLKEKKKAYLKAPLIQTNTTIDSPGYRYFKDDKGNISSEYKKDWKIHILTRPDLLKK